MRGSRTRDRPARHVLAAADQATGVVLASTDVDANTNEITRFDAVLDQISDLRGVVVSADALHCQRDHVTYLAETGRALDSDRQRQPADVAPADGRSALAADPEADRTDERGHGRREIRTLKILSVAAGIEFPQAAQAIQIRRRRRLREEPRRFTTETVYAITELHAHEAKPRQLADWIRGHWSIENKTHLSPGPERAASTSTTTVTCCCYGSLFQRYQWVLFNGWNGSSGVQPCGHASGRDADLDGARRRLPHGAGG